MVLDDAEIHLAVAHHGEEGFGRYLGDIAVVPEAQVLQIELLLVDGSRSQDGRVDALVEPLRGNVAGVADLLDLLHLMALALRVAIAQGDVAAELLSIGELIGSSDLPVAESGPA